MFRFRRTAVALALAALATVSTALPALAGFGSSPGRAAGPPAPFVPIPLP